MQQGQTFWRVLPGPRAIKSRAFKLQVFAVACRPCLMKIKALFFRENCFQFVSEHCKFPMNELTFASDFYGTLFNLRHPMSGLVHKCSLVAEQRRKLRRKLGAKCERLCVWRWERSCWSA